MSRTVAGNTDVWLIDLKRRGAQTRVTTAPQPDIYPVWSPDGRIVYGGVNANNANGSFDLRLQGSRSIMALQADGKDGPLTVAAEQVGNAAAFSHDGKCVAFESDENETGRFDIYVQPFPGPGPKRVVSMAAGCVARLSGVPLRSREPGSLRRGEAAGASAHEFPDVVARQPRQFRMTTKGRHRGVELLDGCGGANVRCEKIRVPRIPPRMYSELHERAVRMSRLEYPENSPSMGGGDRDRVPSGDRHRTIDDSGRNARQHTSREG